jgi:phosphoribosyl-ATP pyrophosphohydrolase
MAKPLKKKVTGPRRRKPSLAEKFKRTDRDHRSMAAGVITDPASAQAPGSAVLDRLFAVVTERRGADPALSHSARLLSRGIAKVAQKFGEEAVECLIDAVARDHDGVVAESADVLYHLIVLWVASDVGAEEVWAELARREGISGIAERASRPGDMAVAFTPKTTKIP